MTMAGGQPPAIGLDRGSGQGGSVSTLQSGTPSPARAGIGAQVASQLDAAPEVGRVEVPELELYYHVDFLTAAECEALSALIDSGRRPSALLTDRPEADFRNSESCDLDRWLPLVRSIDERIADLLGIAPEYGETIQGQRYAPGQHFRAHQDYFHESESYFAGEMQSGGQRTWTAMVYLNDVEAGGETLFSTIGIKIAPLRGLLVTWNNMALDGSPNPYTMHEGLDVERGVKYIVTKWFREDAWLRD